MERLKNNLQKNYLNIGQKTLKKLLSVWPGTNFYPEKQEKNFFNSNK